MTETSDELVGDNSYSILLNQNFIGDNSDSLELKRHLSDLGSVSRMFFFGDSENPQTAFAF